MSNQNNFQGYQEIRLSTAAENGQSMFAPSATTQGDPRLVNGGYGQTHASAPFQYGPNVPAFPGHNVTGVECTSCEPSHGLPGTELTIGLCSRQPIPIHRTKTCVLALGNRSEGRMHANGSDGNSMYYVLRALAPPTGMIALETPVTALLAVQLEDTSGQTIGYTNVGTFRYDPVPKASSEPASASEPSRKRRMSAASPADQVPVKKTSFQQLQQIRSQDQSRRTSSVYGSESTNDAAPSPGPSSAVSSSFGGQLYQNVGYGGHLVLPHHGPQQQQGSESTASIQPSDARLVSSASAPSSHFRAEYLQSNTSMGSGQNQGQRQSPTQSLSRSNPTLVRTSTVPQVSNRYTFDTPTSSDFNPYTIYPDNKAFLNIKGNLDAMAEHWTDEECEAQRRLVEFTREQEGNYVSTTFKPVTLEQRAPNSICVSCIWWEEKDEAYVTSVDTIQLLESLVAVRFTVEEKNRIRRNLEGFRPMTVAKGKADSEKFFKLIMDFPSPKPRNIEKDVKVFPWHVLKHALKKIIGKYSASYASTQGRIPPSGSSSSATHAASFEPYASSPATIGGGIMGSQTAPPGVIHPYAHAERPSMPPGSQSYPVYGMPTGHVTYPQMQHSTGQYVVPQPPPPPYPSAGYGPVPDTSWARGQQETGNSGSRSGTQVAQQVGGGRSWQQGPYSGQAGEHSASYPPPNPPLRPSQTSRDVAAQQMQPGQPPVHSYHDPRYPHSPYEANQGPRKP